MKIFNFQKPFDQKLKVEEILNFVIKLKHIFFEPLDQNKPSQRVSSKNRKIPN
jgi:hypothetical protein